MLQRRYRKKTLGGVAGRQTTKPSKKCQAGNFIIPRETQAYAGLKKPAGWLPRLPVLPARTGSDIGRLETGSNSNFKFEF